MEVAGFWGFFFGILRGLVINLTSSTIDVRESKFIVLFWKLECLVVNFKK